MFSFFFFFFLRRAADSRTKRFPGPGFITFLFFRRALVLSPQFSFLFHVTLRSGIFFFPRKISLLYHYVTLYEGALFKREKFRSLWLNFKLLRNSNSVFIVSPRYLRGFRSRLPPRRAPRISPIRDPGIVPRFLRRFPSLINYAFGRGVRGGSGGRGGQGRGANVFDSRIEFAGRNLGILALEH